MERAAKEISIGNRLFNRSQQVLSKQQYFLDCTLILKGQASAKPEIHRKQT